MIVNQYKLFNKVLMVGFNRRFSPLILKAKSLLKTETAKAFVMMREWGVLESIGSKIQRLEADE